MHVPAQNFKGCNRLGPHTWRIGGSPEKIEPTGVSYSRPERDASRFQHTNRSKSANPNRPKLYKTHLLGWDATVACPRSLFQLRWEVHHRSSMSQTAIANTRRREHQRGRSRRWWSRDFTHALTGWPTARMMKVSASIRRQRFTTSSTVGLSTIFLAIESPTVYSFLWFWPLCF